MATLGALLWIVLAVELALFVGALVSLLLAWRSGEARQQQRHECGYAGENRGARAGAGG